MLNTAKTSLNYKDVEALSLQHKKLRLYVASLWLEPWANRGLQFLKEQLLLNYMTDDLIKCKQWISTDRSNLEEHEDDFDDFLDKIEFQRVKKASLKFDEAVLILDFAENHSFVAQDCVQSYHWNNAQATIHPFVFF